MGSGEGAERIAQLEPAHRGRMEHDASEVMGRRPAWLERRTLVEK